MTTKINIQLFLESIKALNKTNISEPRIATKVLFVLNNCEVIGEPCIPDTDKFPEKGITQFLLNVESEIEYTEDNKLESNFNIILLKNATVKTNNNNRFTLEDLIINTDTINAVIPLSEEVANNLEF